MGYRRRQNATAAEKSLRTMLRNLGFYKVEAVPWIRQPDGAHTAIVCWPATDVAKAVELISAEPEATYLEITKIHISYPNRYYNVDSPQAYTGRVYIKWAS